MINLWTSFTSFKHSGEAEPGGGNRLFLRPRADHFEGWVGCIKVIPSQALYSVVCLSDVRYRCHQTKSPLFPIYTVDRFTKTFFWNFQSIQADLCYILIYKQMLEKAFCSNIAPSLSSGNHLLYKAEYMGRSCPNQVLVITCDRSYTHYKKVEERARDWISTRLSVKGL